MKESPPKKNTKRTWRDFIKWGTSQPSEEQELTPEKTV